MPRSRTGIDIVRSKQEIIDYYKEWFDRNGWSVNSSVQAQPGLYLMSAQKPEEGTMQINIMTEQGGFLSNDEVDTGEDLRSEFSGLIQVFIIYGFGR
jgi:hypothetical protein